MTPEQKVFYQSCIEAIHIYASVQGIKAAVADAYITDAVDLEGDDYFSQFFCDQAEAVNDFILYVDSIQYRTGRIG